METGLLKGLPRALSGVNSRNKQWFTKIKDQRSLAGQKNNSIYLEMKALTAAAAAVLDSSKEISLSSDIKLSIEKHLEIN